MLFWRVSFVLISIIVSTFIIALLNICVRPRNKKLISQSLREKYLSKTTVQQAKAIKEWNRRRDGEDEKRRTPKIVQPRIIDPKNFSRNQINKQNNQASNQPILRKLSNQPSTAPPKPTTAQNYGPPVQVGSASFSI